MANIRISPEEIDAKVAYYKSMEGQVNQLITEIMRNAQECADSWEGKASEAFYELVNKVQNDVMKPFEQAMATLSVDLDKVKAEFVNADEGAQRAINGAMN